MDQKRRGVGKKKEEIGEMFFEIFIKRSSQDEGRKYKCSLQFGSSFISVALVRKEIMNAFLM